MYSADFLTLEQSKRFECQHSISSTPISLAMHFCSDEIGFLTIGIIHEQAEIVVNSIHPGFASTYGTFRVQIDSSKRDVWQDTSSVPEVICGDMDSFVDALQY